MNEKDIENNKIENLLKKVNISEPTPLLKERIITEAKKVWNQSSQEIPWQIPIRRLVASAAAAVLIISIADIYNNHILKKWQFKNAGTTTKQAPDLETLPDIPYRPFVRHLVLINRKPSINDASVFRDYTERLQQVLNEMQQNGSSYEQSPEGGRSHLFNVQSDSYYYS